MVTIQHLRQLNQSNSQIAAAVLSRAMVNNPIHQAVYQRCGEQEQQTIQSGFQTLLTQRLGDVLLAFSGKDVIGVCRFHPCHGNRAIAPDIQAVLQTDPAMLTTIQSRKQYWQGIWHRLDPNILHSHLGPIGVLPEWQHQGVGTRLMTEYCQFVDQQDLPAYLEADNPKNVRFYEQFGFSVIARTDVLGTEHAFMWRDRSLT